MLPDRVSNPGHLTYESGAYRLRYAARPLTVATLNLVVYCETNHCMD